MRPDLPTNQVLAPRLEVEQKLIFTLTIQEVRHSGRESIEPVNVLTSLSC
jgi:hypothetical protein